jgi:NSS family neurotransmitter:Na+ symporter
MASKHFIVSLLAFSSVIHLLRFPYLILENGGGAYLILFFLTLNLVALPLLIAEKVLDNRFNQIDLPNLIRVRKGEGWPWLENFFAYSWFSLRALILIGLLIFFLYLGSSSFVYMLYFFKSLFQPSLEMSDLPHVPELQLSWVGPVVWCLGVFLIWARYFKLTRSFFVDWLLPFSFCSLFVIFLKIIFLVEDFEGLKILFYPDFAALSSRSLLTAIGHSLACLFIGVGLYDSILVGKKSVDSIEVFIRATLLSVSLAIMVGVMALPMIEQVRESPFGVQWLFQILPRWLSYGEFGAYYCGLFFFSLAVLSFYIGLYLLAVAVENIKLIYRKGLPPAYRLGFSLFSALFCAGMIITLQGRLQGWTGQSFLFDLDRISFDFIFPLLALMMIGLVFRYTRKGERKAVFSEQQIFYHDRYFFLFWENASLPFISFLILLAWFIGN